MFGFRWQALRRAGVPNISGQWSGAWNGLIDGGAGALTGTITQTGASISGTCDIGDTDLGDLNNRSFSGSIVGNVASFTLHTSAQGYKIDVNFTKATISSDGMRMEDGEYKFYVDGEFYDYGSFYMERTQPPCGNGDLENGEECDDGAAVFNHGDYCDDLCKLIPCGKPTNSAGELPKTSDALFVLKAAVSGSNCDNRVCDVNSNNSVTSTDALLILKGAVGQPVGLNCPA